MRVGVWVLLLTACRAQAAPPISVPVAEPPEEGSDEASIEGTEEALIALADRAADHPEIAASALFRAAVHAHDAEAPARVRAHLERLLRDYPEAREAPAAFLQLAYVAMDTEDEELHAASLISLLCPGHLESPFTRPLPAEPVLADCQPRALASGLFHAWFLLGDRYFDMGPTELDRAAEAYARALEHAEDAPSRTVALYKMAWSFYRVDRYEAAIQRFDEALSVAPDGDRLGAESAQYIAICIAEADWDTDGVDDALVGLARPEAQAWLSRSAHAVPVLRALVGVERDQLACSRAREALEALARRDAAAASELEPTLARCAR